MGYFNFAFPSGLCFLIGAILQTYVAISDWNDAKVVEEARIAVANGIIVADDDDWVATDFHPKEVVYYVFNTLGPVCYVLNAVVEIRRVLAALRLHSSIRLVSSEVASDDGTSDDCTQDYLETYVDPDEHACDSTPLLGSSQSYKVGDAIGVVEQLSSITTPLLSPTQSYTDVKSKDTCSTFASGNTSFDHHGDSQSLASSATSSSSSSDSSDSVTELERRWELAASIIFGLGAILETYSTLLDDIYDNDDDDNGTTLADLTSGSLLPFYLTYGLVNIASMHLYLLCGLVELYMQRNSLRLSILQNFFSRESSYDSYVIVGIVFFVSGTLLDCIMSFLFENNIVTSEFVLAKCDLASAILWNICAPLYLMADLVLLHESYGDEDLNMYQSIWNIVSSWCKRTCCNENSGRGQRSRRNHYHHDSLTPEGTEEDGVIFDSLRRNLLLGDFLIPDITTKEERRNHSADYLELP
jgi:hypothetical protein